MPIQTNDNIQVNAPKDPDYKKGRFVSGEWRPFISTTEFFNLWPEATRYKGQLVPIIVSTNPETYQLYWFVGGVANNNLVPFAADLSQYYTKTQIDAIILTEQTARIAADNNKVDKTTTVNNKPLSGNITIDKSDVGLGNVDNTSDLNKPISNVQSGVNTILGNLIQEESERAQAVEDDIYNQLLEPWTDIVIFTYDGTNNTQQLSFSPNTLGGLTSLNTSHILNPYYDFYYDENTIVLRQDILTQGIEYTLITQYFK